MDPGLVKSLLPLSLIFLVCKVGIAIPALQCCYKDYLRWCKSSAHEEVWIMGAHQISISSLSLERGLKTSGREISSKNICGNTHIDSWTVHASSINLSSHHLSIFHTLFQTPTIHSSSIHHPSNQTSIHPSPTISSLSIIMHSPPNHYPSVYLFYTHLSSIYLLSTYPFIQPAIIILSIYRSYIIHLFTIQQPLIVIHHISCIH